MSTIIIIYLKVDRRNRARNSYILERSEYIKISEIIYACDEVWLLLLRLLKASRGISRPATKPRG
jgi:hypothetical protein